ncbi:MAG TPA: penicillin acylase family protein, partial [Pyrinomonadaceae bacterium]|nr:penicillin acylase family protein [Pyrinomonadaceae bacterium]
MRRILPILLVVLTVSVHFGFGQASEQNIKVAGLSAPVTVQRDARGVPYITAANDADLYFAQGFVMASDRLWQMDVARRTPRGQLAELFGAIRLEEDKRWRRFGFAALADQSIAAMNAETRAPLENYARGVNAFMATLDDKTTPPEFKILQYKPTPWLPTDSLIIAANLADALSSTWRLDLIRASLANIDPQKLADLSNQVTPYDVVLFGSDKGRNPSGSEGASSPDGTLPTGRVSALKMAERDDELRRSSL